MNYFGTQTDLETSENTTGVLLVNLGTPDRAVCPALRRYLAEFLMDPRVIEIPKLFRLLLVRGIIVNFRAHKSAATYRKIWREEGSPLLLNSLALGDALQTKLGNKFVVKVAMRYGKPSVESRVRDLHKMGVRKLVVIPLYPQYSGSTNGSTFDAIANAFKRFRWVPSIEFINAYYQRDDYIEAIAESIRVHWQLNGRAQKLLMSFHGVPQKYITKGDPYQGHCTQTANRIALILNLQDDQWQLVFQSRFGAEEWLQPYCEQTLKSLPAEGVKSVDIICPGFSADCLETLEEIEQENKEYFLAAGGTDYHYIPCLNDSPAHVELFANMIEQRH